MDNSGTERIIGDKIKRGEDMRTDFDFLLEKAQVGEKTAVEEILIKLKPFIVKQATRYFIKGYEVEDMIQIGNLSLLKAIRQYKWKPGRSFFSYALTAIKNNYYYEVRQKCRTNSEESFFNAEGEETFLENLTAEVNVEEEVIQKENQRELREILDKLSGEERELIDAIYFKGMTLKEYALLKGVNYITLVKRRNRLLLKMRKEKDLTV